MSDVIEWLKNIARRHRDLREIAALGDRDLADLGLTRDQARHLAAMPDDVPGRVEAMARVFGVDADTLHRERDSWTEMLETCAECGALPACKRLMDAPTQSEEAAARICPNAAGFAVLRD